MARREQEKPRELRPMRRRERLRLGPRLSAGYPWDASLPTLTPGFPVPNRFLWGRRAVGTAESQTLISAFIDSTKLQIQITNPYVFLPNSLRLIDLATIINLDANLQSWCSDKTLTCPHSNKKRQNRFLITSHLRTHPHPRVFEICPNFSTQVTAPFPINVF